MRLGLSRRRQRCGLPILNGCLFAAGICRRSEFLRLLDRSFKVWKGLIDKLLPNPRIRLTPQVAEERYLSCTPEQGPHLGNDCVDARQARTKDGFSLRMIGLNRL